MGIKRPVVNFLFNAFFLFSTIAFKRKYVQYSQSKRRTNMITYRNFKLKTNN